MSQPRSEFKKLLDSVAAVYNVGKSAEAIATVYGQAPGAQDMRYPCIRYDNDSEDVMRADNIPYNITDRYMVTVIERLPDKPLAKLVRELPMCSHNRSYPADNLYHTVYTIYF